MGCEDSVGKGRLIKWKFTEAFIDVEFDERMFDFMKQLLKML